MESSFYNHELEKHPAKMKSMPEASNTNTEIHPFPPFINSHVKVLMIGSFPPARSKWRMEFYYPNFQNDMWRIFGLVFFDDKDYFVTEDGKSFDIVLLKSFLSEKRIGVADMGKEVIRQKDNASDKFLEIVQPLNISKLLQELPGCNAFITTGEKATETLRIHLSDTIRPPKVGGRTTFSYLGREFSLYRMPSSSRAYPMPVVKKAEMYKQCFKEIGIF